MRFGIVAFAAAAFFSVPVLGQYDGEYGYYIYAQLYVNNGGGWAAMGAGYFLT